LLQPQQRALQLQPASKSSMSLLHCCSCPAPPPQHNTPLPPATTHSDTPLCMAQGHAPLSPRLARLESLVVGCQLALRLVQVCACAVSRGSTAARSLHCCCHFNSLLRLCSRLPKAPSLCCAAHVLCVTVEASSCEQGPHVTRNVVPASTHRQHVQPQVSTNSAISHARVWHATVAPSVKSNPVCS
jgi:hypothetical protein